MTTSRNTPTVQPSELLDDTALFSLEDLARICHVAPGWVSERLQAGLLQADRLGGHWRFASATVVRARRLAQLETTFGADPQLAALTADLIEEVAQLRQRLKHLEAATGHGRRPG
ncbi:MAG: MerR family transcriptional regulator [Comamonadaceae bacterium]|nr:MerR family transcriptional regulator [Comamonadaceae bacterium]